MATIKNIEQGVERAMKAYLREAGATEQAAASRAKAKLAAAVSYVREQIAAQGDDPDPAPAFAKLKTWTRANA